MITRSALRQFPNMRAAHAALLQLDAEYLRTNKRKSGLELTLCSTFVPMLDERGRQSGEREVIEVRCVYDAPTQDADYQWFKERAEGLT